MLTRPQIFRREFKPGDIVKGRHINFGREMMGVYLSRSPKGRYPQYESDIIIIQREGREERWLATETVSHV